MINKIKHSIKNKKSFERVRVEQDMHMQGCRASDARSNGEGLR